MEQDSDRTIGGPGFGVLDQQVTGADRLERFETGGTGYGDFKKELFEKLWEYFSPMRKRREELLADKLYIGNVLVRGAKRANEVADDVMTRVRAAVGLR